jgi:hypothetical protein
VSLPNPEPGLVIHYSYLWEREAAEGLEEGSKDRPCAIVAAVIADDMGTRVVVVPISHRPPDAETIAIEIPAAIKQLIGLDASRSWIVVSDANDFNWAGPDIRPRPGSDMASVAYGMLPPRFFASVQKRFLQAMADGKTHPVRRSE